MWDHMLTELLPEGVLSFLHLLSIPLSYCGGAAADLKSAKESHLPPAPSPICAGIRALEMFATLCKDETSFVLCSNCMTQISMYKLNYTFTCKLHVEFWDITRMRAVVGS